MAEQEGQLCMVSKDPCGPTCSKARTWEKLDGGSSTKVMVQPGMGVEQIEIPRTVVDILKV